MGNTANAVFSVGEKCMACASSDPLKSAVDTAISRLELRSSQLVLDSQCFDYRGISAASFNSVVSVVVRGWPRTKFAVQQNEVEQFTMGITRKAGGGSLFPSAYTTPSAD